MQDDARDPAEEPPKRPSREPRWTVPALAVGYLTTAILLVEISRAFELSRAATAGLVVLFALGIYGFSNWAFRRLHGYHLALEASEERYAAFVRNSSEGIWRLELREPIDVSLPVDRKVDLLFEHGYYAEVNDAFVAMYGATREELTGSDLTQTLPREENEEMVRYFFENEMRFQEAVSKEVTPDGRILYFQSNCHGVVEKGRLVRVWGNQVDVTQQHLAEEELERKSRLLSGAERIAKTGSWTYEPEHRRFLWSDNLFAIGKVEVDGFDLALDNVLGIVHRDDRDRWQRSLEKVIEEGEPFTREIRIFRADGSMIYMETRAEPIFDDAGRVTAVTGVGRDVTQEKLAEMARQELELQVRQLQKMEAMGTLASGIAHDFNNILSATMGYADIALGELDPEHPAYASIQQIEKANFRAKDLVDQILKHGRRLEQRREPVQPAVVIREALGLLKASLPSRISVRQELVSQDAKVLGDPSQLHQVVINLCTNACHAMPEGGTLTLRLDQVQTTEPIDATVGRLPAGSYVHLTVTDTGAGIHETVRGRIFEPFFTTKEPGRGTGLGLSTVQGIVLDHQGGIRVRCPSEGGTVFELFFPLCEDEAEEDRAAGKATPVGRRETVLLVDDEVPLMTLGEKMLHRLGYHAVAFNSPRAALDLFEQDPDRFDLVVTDLRMPEMSGLELAQEIRELRPDAKVLVTTGFSEADLDVYLDEGLIQGCLIKPFNLAAMGRSIGELLSSEDDSATERPKRSRKSLPRSGEASETFH